MKLIIVKGVAGLGNRMTALGNALDLALHYDCPFHVDWRDSEWRRPFSDTFEIKHPLRLKDMPSAMKGAQVFPRAWGNRWTECSAKDIVDNDIDRRKRELLVQLEGTDRNDLPKPSQGGHFTFRTNAGERSENPDVLVWTSFGRYAYSDALLNILDVTEYIRNELNALFFDPRLHDGDYRAWHFRNTDRDAEMSPDEFVSKVRKEADRQVQVVCTDHRDTVDRLQDLQCGNIVCKSLVPRFSCGGGPHHRGDEVLKSQGMTKEQVNTSALTDLCLLAGASKRTYLCRASTYRKFVERGLRQNWFKKVLTDSISQ